MAKLVVKKGRNQGSEFKLNADRLIMGRRSVCPIPILDPRASREHAVVIRKDGAFFLQDLSRNGTIVNTHPASKNGDGPTPLNYGDQIRVGETVLEMVDETKEPIEIEIPGYHFLEKIGFGGMGCVYKAKQLSMDRIVALKVLNEKYSANREFVDRFIREARAAGRLNHPNVIHVHDVSKAGGRHYFSMEYIDGHSVKELLRIHRKLSSEKTVDIGLQTAKALEFAHECGIVHRDIKPDNIMLTTDAVVKIADLGIAKLWEEEGGGTRDTRKVMGTPHYMAPEQALGKDIDYRVDIYALGATMYHMLTGTTPFSGNTAHEVLRAHIKDSLLPIQEYAPDVPETLCFVVERMMAKLPEKRYANMTRVIEDLERVRQGIDDGIEQIEVGDSTILRAVSLEEAQAQVRGRTQDARTGVHTPVRVVFLYAMFAGVFIFLLAAALWGWMSGEGGGKAPPKPSPPQIETPPARNRKEPDLATQRAAGVVKKVGEAKRLLAADPVSEEAERVLKEIVATYPTLSDEAKALLEGLKKAREDAVLAKAQGAFDLAQKFESERQGDPAAVAENWQRVLAALQAAPELFRRAKARAEKWQEKEKQARSVELREAWLAVKKNAENAAETGDFDAALRALDEFLKQGGEAPQKEEANKMVEEVKARALAAFTNAQNDADLRGKEPSRPIPAALDVWSAYLRSVQDGAHRGAAEAAVKELEERAERALKAEDEKVRKSVATLDYEGALRLQNRLTQRMAGAKWSEALTLRGKQLEAQESLHKMVLEKLSERLRAGPIVLDFKPDFPQWKHVEKWTIGGAQGDQLTFMPSTGAAIGLPMKFGALNVREQYKLYLLLLSPLEVEDHLSMVVFCEERGLTDEAALHRQKAERQP